MDSLLELFCDVDDFFREFLPIWNRQLISSGQKQRKRAIIETIIDQHKNISHIEHSRHRSVSNFLVIVLCGLIAYCRRSSKPSLGLADLLPLNA